MSNGKTVLITGANSGIGFEAARQFAELKWSRVLLGCRNPERGKAAVERLTRETGMDVFALVVVDVSELASVSAAVEGLVERGESLGALVLNAGGTPPPGDNGLPLLNSDGIGVPFAVNVLGHSALASQAWQSGILQSNSIVVYASSETARGVPAMRLGPLNLTEFAAGRSESPAQAIESFARTKHLSTATGMDTMTEYGTHKLIGTLWMSALARRMDGGRRVYSISPGSTHSTAAGSDGSFLMRIMSSFLMPYVMPLFGMAHSANKGARRYLEPLLAPDSFENGGFYASPGTGLTGPLALQTQNPELLDEELQEAAWAALSSMTAGLSDTPTREVST